MHFLPLDREFVTLSVHHLQKVNAQFACLSLLRLMDLCWNEIRQTLHCHSYSFVVEFVVFPGLEMKIKNFQCVLT